MNESPRMWPHRSCQAFGAWSARYHVCQSEPLASRHLLPQTLITPTSRQRSALKHLMQIFPESTQDHPITCLSFPTYLSHLKHTHLPPNSSPHPHPHPAEAQCFACSLGKLLLWSADQLRPGVHVSSSIPLHPTPSAVPVLMVALPIFCPLTLSCLSSWSSAV